MIYGRCPAGVEKVGGIGRGGVVMGVKQIARGVIDKTVVNIYIYIYIYV